MSIFKLCDDCSTKACLTKSGCTDKYFLYQMIIFGFLGLVIGCIIDVVFIILQNRIKSKKWFINIIFFIFQMSTSIIILWLLRKYFILFSNQFQRTLPGLIFTASYFGIQSNLFLNVQVLYKDQLIQRIN